LSQRNVITAAVAAAGLVIATVTSAVSVPTAQATAAQATPGPALKLIAVQHTITAPRFGKQVFVDPGVWLAALGAPLQLDVGRASYRDPVAVTQVISQPGLPPQTRPLPASILDGWNGLKNFISLTIKNKAGRVVATSRLGLCPDSFDPERARPDSPSASPYPQQCAASDPFQIGTVWGIQQGWAVDATQFGRTYQLALGTYRVTESITSAYTRLFGIPPADATATVVMQVVKGSACCIAGPAPQGTSPGTPQRPAALAELPAVPVLANPPESALPDLVPLPAWGIRTTHAAGRDLVDFAATVWVGGNGQLDVQGFRVNSSPVMAAYQYFWQDGQVIGRARVGTMGFDSLPGHNHWHFEQFAAYRLLGPNGKLVVRSQKTGFCIAPTDAVDLLLPSAVWQPPFIGFSGQCGSPTALWVREMMPVGWGDTYIQSIAGQAFDITNLPNGTYYIQVTANPGHLLHETTTANDVTVRKVIISGTRGHRHVKVPAWNGIDPEA
jgi:Lysyl oxidase